MFRPTGVGLLVILEFCKEILLGNMGGRFLTHLVKTPTQTLVDVGLTDV